MSFVDAAEIGEGTCSDALVPGEMRFYKFRVEWGQRPVVTMRSDGSGRESVDEPVLNIYSPLWERLDWGWLYLSSGADCKISETTVAPDRKALAANRAAGPCGGIAVQRGLLLRASGNGKGS